MVSMRMRISNFKKERVIVVLTIVIVVIQIASVTSSYIPASYSSAMNAGIRRQDSDYEDSDNTPSASYQNQDDNSANDGYDDNEPDGPYEETPREAEGQADLERFFDDHLGASERDGMDKENLPSNIINSILVSPYTFNRYGSIVGNADQLMSSSKVSTDITPQDKLFNYLDPSKSSPKLATTYTQSPDRSLTVESHIIHDPRIRIEPSRFSRNGLDVGGSEVVSIEDDDWNQVYATNITNKPFRIEALGGYDPEEDFQDASRDIEEPRSTDLKKNLLESNNKDINFNDPDEPDGLFEDASETDEVTFGQDPYQTDFEEELQGQSPDKEVKSRLRSEDNPGRDEDSEGAWVNDGVEDIEVPSQSDQNLVLDRAAKQDALARKESGDAQSEENPHRDSDTYDSDNQRMNNTDYLKNDTKIDDFDY